MTCSSRPTTVMTFTMKPRSAIAFAKLTDRMAGIPLRESDALLCNLVEAWSHSAGAQVWDALVSARLLVRSNVTIPVIPAPIDATTT